MAAVVLAIAHKHTFRFKEQSILACRAGFVIIGLGLGILDGNNENTACAWVEEYGIFFSFCLLYIYIYKLNKSFIS